jgi:hypothetical protein
VVSVWRIYGKEMLAPDAEKPTKRSRLPASGAKSRPVKILRVEKQSFVFNANVSRALT